ncbi:hypothetical protein GALMADRAFT_162291 [Galerina marginata CBS 339.88]|uniref:Uncharacterized protein n=1 Tax=Galerina marginata (strain CBS 339.88) TaxID=685588 RepID=A0A067SE42_GALM3|nr:hypothetical protein GALMADRAFT_162291 [Galerina marginata CBS 339.88]
MAQTKPGAVPSAPPLRCGPEMGGNEGFGRGNNQHCTAPRHSPRPSLTPRRDNHTQRRPAPQDPHSPPRHCKNTRRGVNTPVSNKTNHRRTADPHRTTLQRRSATLDPRCLTLSSPTICDGRRAQYLHINKEPTMLVWGYEEVMRRRTPDINTETNRVGVGGMQPQSASRQPCPPLAMTAVTRPVPPRQRELTAGVGWL